MMHRQSLPLDLHTADAFEKAKALRSGSARHRMLTIGVIAGLVLMLMIIVPRWVQAAQQYEYTASVESGAIARVDMPVDAPVDLTAFMASVSGSLDPATFGVAEVDEFGALIQSGVLFQFDPAADFDPTTNAVGNLVFVMNDTTPALTTRHFRVSFDVVGGCGDCPAPPAVPVPTTVDSLMYENQMTYLVDTPRANYYYHLDGAGLASLIDNDGQDWISFHDVGGSGETGEYRGIPNLVFTSNNSAASFFHPGFHNATSTLISHGPLKVSVRSVTNSPTNEWIVRWDFYQTFARLTVEQTGTSNGGDYWLLYEGTPGGSLDAGDVIVRSSGSSNGVTSVWEQALPDPSWTYFHDTSGARYLYVSDDQSDASVDSYRSMGQTSGSNPGMTVFGLGRSLFSLTPGMSGAGRTFTIGLGEDNTNAAADITAAYTPLIVSVSAATSSVSSVTGEVPREIQLNQNYPNPFNPRTTISFSLAARGAAKLAIYDAAGRLVRTLVDESLPSGPHAYVWNGQNENGRMVASGMYFYRLKTPDRVLNGKMTLLE